jgi:hypothetical protein
MYPSMGMGNAGSFGTQQVASSATIINPCFMSFCRWPGIMVEGVQCCSAMARGGWGSNTSEIPFSFPDIGKEVRRRWRIIRKDVGCAMVTANFNNPAVSQPRKSGWALSDIVRGLVNRAYMPPLVLAHHASYDSTERGSHIPNGPHDC